MELPLKLCLSLVSLVGASTIVSVPVALNINSRNIRSADRLPGGGVSQASLNLDLCKEEGDEGQALFELGSSEFNNLCGKVRKYSKNEGGLEEYTKFFKERGGMGDQDWNQSINQGKGTQQCYQGDFLKGAIFDSYSSNGVQHLGLCGDSKIENTKFVKKVQKSWVSTNVNGWDLGVCDNDCGESEAGSFADSTLSLTKEKEGNGKQVVFYSKEK